MTVNPTDMTHRTLAEFMVFMTGDYLGGGSARRVVAHPSDPTKVIKIEDSAGSFQNVAEWEFWEYWKHDKDVARWLAPCHSISSTGTFLIMDRTKPLHKVPDRLPRFLTDHKAANYGLLKGKVVCHDYGKIVMNLNMKQRKWMGEKI